MIDSEFIVNAKKAVDEFLAIVKTPLDTSMLNSEGEKKIAIKTKKQAILQAKNFISGIVKVEAKEKVWAKKAIENLISAGEDSINDLFKSLGTSINAEDADGKTNFGEVANALSAKEIAFNDSIQILDAIEELRNVAKNEDILISDAEFRIGYAEKFAANPPKSLAGVLKDGSIAIDPNGTIGEKVNCYGLDITLPKFSVRSNKTYKTSDTPRLQMWKRMPMPDVTPENASKHTEFIKAEYTRRWEGLFFYNNGVPEYITGAHWFFLQHLRTEADGGFFFFTKMQQKLFWFMEAVWVDDRCYGLILEKIRRGGFSHCFLAFMLCKTLMSKDKLSGMTSKTNDDAAALFDKLTKMFASLPFYFKPITRVERPKKALEFMAPSSRLSKNNKNSNARDEDYLNTTINYEATKVDSYDGTALYIYIADEFSKWTKVMGNTLTHYDMVRKCVTKGRRITGKIFILSTIENVTGLDAEDPEALAGDRYKALFEDSDPNERDENGRTISGLYRLFISVYEHYEGFIDKYGNCIRKDKTVGHYVRGIDGNLITIGVETFIKRELAKLEGNLKKVMEYLRKTPITSSDGFAVAEGCCAFNQAHISQQMVYNNTLDEQPYRIGNFRWDGEVDGGKVEWVDDSEGRFKVSWLPSIPNNVMYRDGHWIPLNANVGAFGVDPYRVSKTVDGKGSKGAIHGFSVCNTIGAPQHNFFLEYINRPKTKEIFFDDCIMALIYYGMPVLIENNVNNLLDELYRRKYSKFSIRRPDKSKDKLTDDERKYGGIPTSSENVSQMMYAAMENFIEYHVGETEMCFNATLQDWLVFDERNRTKRDASISSSLALLAIQGLLIPKEKIKNTLSKESKTILRTFQNTGKYTHYELS